MFPFKQKHFHQYTLVCWHPCHVTDTSKGRVVWPLSCYKDFQNTTYILLKPSSMIPLTVHEGNIHIRSKTTIQTKVTPHIFTQNLKALGIWILSLIKFSTSYFPRNVRILTHTYITTRWRIWKHGGKKEKWEK